MNRFLIFLLFISNSALAQVNLALGLKAYYPFSGKANDVSGNNNNPVFNNAILTTDRFSNTNSAYHFNGTSSYMQIPNSPSLNMTNKMSLAAWVRPTGYYTGTCYQNIMVMKADVNNLPTNYFLNFGDIYTGCTTPTTTKQRFSGNSVVAPTPIVQLNQWYSVVWTSDGINERLYVNCELKATSPVSGTAYSNAMDLFFGHQNNATFPYWLNGDLDEVRIYNRALNKDEVLALCDNKPVQTPDIPCPKATIVAAKFDFDISNCTTTAFNLTTTATKNIKTIQWFFGDGTTSNKLSPVHNYQKKGTYKVKTIVTNKAGCADTFTRQIQFRELKTDFIFSELGEPGEIQFKTKNNNATYSWNFGDGTTAKNQSVVTHLYNKAGQFIVQMLAQNNDGCRDTAEKRIDIVLPEFITDVSPSNNPVIISPELPVVQLEKRDKDVIQTITVESDSISISLYDNGIIDGDSITLIFNNKIIVAHQLLSNKPLTLSLKIDREKSSNELVMYAENLGSIPPNTALMIINDGNNRHQVNVSSSKSSNGVVSFTFKR